MLKDIKPIVIMGATASGKTELSLSLARKINAEIISADSRQVYKHLTAGTAKPQGHWENIDNTKTYLVDNIPYHLVDFIDPLSQYNAGEYAQEAKYKIDKIKKSGKNIIITGGTGLYIHSLFNELDQLPKANSELRNELYDYVKKYGKDALYEKLKNIDPISAQKIHPNNTQRIIRAIEISKLTGTPASSLIKGNFLKPIMPFLATLIILKWPKNLLTERIKQRTINAFDKWVQETENLISKGYPYDCPGLKSIGYSSIIDFIENKTNKKDTIENIIKLTMGYVKRQNTWFSRYKSANIIEFKDLTEYNVEKITDKILKLHYK